MPQGHGTCPTTLLGNEGERRGGCGTSKPKCIVITETILALGFLVMGKGLDLERQSSGH